jgi:hypothetical protein
LGDRVVGDPAALPDAIDQLRTGDDSWGFRNEQEQDVQRLPAQRYVHVTASEAILLFIDDEIRESTLHWGHLAMDSSRLDFESRS